MEQLNIPHLTQALKTAHSPMKRTKPRAIGTEIVVVRRSSRVASLPAPVYKEHGLKTFEILELPSGRKYRYVRKELGNRVYASDEAREYAINKAEELESKLKSGHLSFIKPMFQSYVTGGWLGLPVNFCRKYLPKNDETIILIDEDGQQFPTLYFSRKEALSAGWRGFSVSHELIDGDALVFHLIKRAVFKVYIIRNKDYYADGELNDASHA
ncbi:B3 domain-containing protein Os06g0194400-like isoform X2 [Rutidosis leptorrhynchoides]|uniref:B3 domain-containing protein Os06g0194400-like isoform X2 n=1 Tax=Rutidosis leptorrhynchoides TaxID=125765 RepID=UPI003A99468F